MTYPMENLTPQLVKPLESEVRLGQGIIRSWDNETFENVVEWRGQELTNVNVLAGTDALSYRAGDPVVLIGNGLGMGTSSWFILGRAVVPGPGTGSEVVEFMQSGLVSQIIDDIVTQLLTSPAGQELAAFVIGQRVSANFVPDSHILTSQSYTTLPTAGPSVTIPVSDSGTAIVWLSSQLTALNTGADTTTTRGFMSFQVSGATNLAASDLRSYSLGNFATMDVSEAVSVDTRMSNAIALTGLNPGTHTISARYRVSFAPTGVAFDSRSIVAMGL